MPDHVILPVEGGGYQCQKCGRSWSKTATPSSECPGVMIYAWDPWPQGLYTQSQLNQKGYKPGPVAGVIPRSKSPDGWLKLYRVEEAVPKKKPTEKQLAALKKAQEAAEVARHCSECGSHLWGRRELRMGMCERCADERERQDDQASAAREAFDLVCQGDFVVFDSETTDLGGYFIEVAAIDQYGATLIDQRIAPLHLIAPGAFEVHGIRDEELVGCPTFWEVSPRLREVLHGKNVVIYNSEFDMGVLHTEMMYRGWSSWFEAYPIKPADTFCAMHLFAAFYGEWHSYYKNYRWQKLDTAASCFDVQVDRPAHSALGDCLRTLGVIYGMAEWYRKEILTR